MKKILLIIIAFFAGAEIANAQCTEVGSVEPEISYNCTSGSMTFLGQGDVYYEILLNNTGLPVRHKTATTPSEIITFGSLNSGTYYLYGEFGCRRLLKTITLTVPSNTPAVITLTPSSEPSLVCEDAAFTLTASGAPVGGSYKWKYRGDVNNGAWSNISGVSGSVYNPIGGIPAGEYKVAVANTCSEDSESSVITVVRIQKVGIPTITSGTTLRCREEGYDTYSAIATDATSFTWSISGADGITTNAMTKPGDGYSHSTGTADFNATDTNITIKVTAYGCGGSSKQSSDYVVSTTTLSNKTATPDLSLVCNGVPVNITMTSPEIDVTYKLLKQGVGVVDSEIAATTSSLVLTAPGPGTYTITASDEVCENKIVTSAQTISQKSHGIISIQTSNNNGVDVPINTLCIGDGFKFTASGGNNYRWYWTPSDPNNEHDPTQSVGANSTFPATGVDVESGSYQLKAKDNVCNENFVSDFYNVIQHLLPDVTILEPNTPSKKIASTASQLIRTVAQTDHTYQWYLGNVLKASGSSASYNASEEGTYKVTVISPIGCTKTSDNFSLDVNSPISINIDTVKTVVMPISRISLEANFSDADGTMVSNSWTQLSGKKLVMSATTGTEITLSRLSVGSFQFQIKAIDNFGEESVKLVSLNTINPDNNHNYVKQESIQVSGVTDENTIGSLSVSEKLDSWTYIDGIGRAVQKISGRTSPAQFDLVTPIVYDSLGRESRQYLPIAINNNGQFNDDLLDSAGLYTSDFYDNPLDDIADDIPFGETYFEKSPLNRILKQGAPGASWQLNSGNTIQKVYLANGPNEVILFEYDQDSETIVSTLAYYEKNVLSRTKTIDEHNNDVLEFQDKEGKTICKKVKVSSGVYASTYYIYDDFGNLVVVLPPEAINNIVNGN